MLFTLLISALLLTAPVSANAATPEAEATAQQVLDALRRSQESLKGLGAHDRAGNLAKEVSKSQRQSSPLNGISDPGMAAEWERLRDELGIGHQNQLYIFVSFSMPESLLRAYALDAAQAGGVLVFRGVEPGTTLQEFFQNRLSTLIKPGVFAAPIQIDPRLYDTYEIERVPTIVLAKGLDDELCLDSKERFAEVDGEAVAYQACPAREKSGYWSISGAVTSLYALEQLAEQGAAEASAFIELLRANNEADDPEQQGLDAAQWEERLNVLLERNALLLHGKN